MSETLQTPMPVDPEAFANRALKVPPPDVWTTKTIASWDFAGRIVSRDAPAALFGHRQETASVQARLSRILAMGPHVRALPAGPGIWVDSVMRQIKAVVRDVSNASPAFPKQREALQAKYEKLIVETEIEMERIIRASLGEDRKALENLTSRANATVNAGALPQTQRFTPEKPAPWTALAFVTRLRAWGIYPRRDDATLGFAWVGTAGLLPADMAVLSDRRLDIEAVLAERPDLIGPPPPPPFLPPAAPIEPVAGAAPPPPPPPLAAVLPAAEIEPAEIPAGLGAYVTTATGEVMTAASAAERNKPKRRHTFATTARLPNR